MAQNQGVRFQLRDAPGQIPHIGPVRPALHPEDDHVGPCPAPHPDAPDAEGGRADPAADQGDVGEDVLHEAVPAAPHDLVVLRLFGIPDGIGPQIRVQGIRPEGVGQHHGASAENRLRQLAEGPLRLHLSGRETGFGKPGRSTFPALPELCGGQGGQQLFKGLRPRQTVQGPDPEPPAGTLHAPVIEVEALPRPEQRRKPRRVLVEASRQGPVPIRIHKNILRRENHSSHPKQQTVWGSSAGCRRRMALP